uniref:Uncharacterized protein n=1 Tax=Anguilla anguilla TaxID=7936 RepID=A0A0E9U937_ANGAN
MIHVYRTTTSVSLWLCVSTTIEN